MRWVFSFLGVVAGAGIGVAFAIAIFGLFHLNFDSVLREAFDGFVGFFYLAILFLIPLGVAFVGGFFGYKLGKRLR
jgi:hypothetical protein